MELMRKVFILEKLEYFSRKKFDCKSMLDVKDLLKEYNYFKNNSILTSDYCFLLESVHYDIFKMIDYFIINEMDMQKRFMEEYKIYLPDFQIKIIKSNKKNIPDIWFENNNELIPCEMKKDVINEKALKQIKRYMSYYKCKRGIVVAPHINIDLPNNIEYIKYK